MIDVYARCEGLFHRMGLSAKRPTTPTIVVTALASAYLSAAFVLDGHLDFTGSLFSTYPDNFLTALGPLDLLAWLGLGIVIFCALSLAGQALSTFGRGKAHERRASAFSRSLADGREAEVGSVSPGMTMQASELTGQLSGRRLTTYLKGHRGLFWGIAAVVFAGWFVVWLFYYPGTSMNDQIGIITDPLGSSSGHPLVYCLLLSGLVNGAKTLLGDGSIGFAAYVLAQMAACAAIVSVMCCWLKWRGAKPAMVWVVALIFALVPIISDNAICSIKDTLFNFVMLLWIPFFDQYLRRRGTLFEYDQERRNYVLLCVLTGITRNNGLIVAPMLMCAIVLMGLKRKGTGKVVAASVLALVIMLVPTGITKVLDVSYRASESLGVPLQQMVAVYVSDEGTTTDSERAVLGSAFDLSKLDDTYYPLFTDGIKYYDSGINNSWINDNKGELLRCWVEIGLSSPANLDIYVRAWLSNVWGCWSPTSEPEPGQSYFFKQVNNVVSGGEDWYESVLSDYKLTCRSLLPDDVATSFKSIWEPLVKCPGTGTLFCLVLVMAVLSCHKEGSAARGILAFVPFLLLWLSLLLSAPLATALRYGLSLLLAIPFYVCLLILPENRTGQMAAAMQGSAMSPRMAEIREEWPF